MIATVAPDRGNGSIETRTRSRVFGMVITQSIKLLFTVTQRKMWNVILMRAKAFEIETMLNAILVIFVVVGLPS